MATQKEKTDKKFDYKTIKTFEDACAKCGIDPTALPELSMIPEELRKPILAAYRLMIIYKAINNGWVPDWGNFNQWKYYPWFRVLSSGFGFSRSYYDYDAANTTSGSRLCTDTEEKAEYMAKQFEQEFIDYMLIS